MDHETMLEHLEELASRLGIEVRYEAAAGRVGIGKLRGKQIAVIDLNLRVKERVSALSTLLAREPINGIYVAPAVRQKLDRARAACTDLFAEGSAPAEDDAPPELDDGADPEECAT